MNTNLSRFFALAIAASLTACGGSSPSSDYEDSRDTPEPTENQAAEQEQLPDDNSAEHEQENESDRGPEQELENGFKPDGEESPEEPDNSSMDTSVSVHFPWRSSVVTGSSLTFQGEISDIPEGHQLLVNGEAVQLTDSWGIQSYSDDPKAGSRKLPNMATSMASLLDPRPSYQWHYVAELVAPGVVEFVIEVVDSDGNPAVPPETIKVARKAVPSTFDFDSVNRRLVGLAGTDMVDLDVESGEVKIDDSLMDSLPIGYCHKPDTDELIYVNTGYSESDRNQAYYVFRRAPLSGDSLPNVFHTQLKLSGKNQDVAVLCHPTRDRVYVVTNRHFFSDSEEQFSSIYELDTSSAASDPWSVLFSGDLWVDGGLAIGEAAMADDHILVYTSERGKSDSQGLYSVSLDNGDVDSAVYAYKAFGTTIAQGSRPEKIYTVHFAGVDILQPNDLHRRISESKEDHNFLDFDQIGSAALDIEANRLLVGDSGQNMIMGIDLETGERESVFSPGQGEGPRMLNPTGVVLDSDYQSAYVLDRGGNTPEKIVHVDLDTGDREVIAILQDDGFNRRTSDIVLDEENGLLYAVRGKMVYRVDLEDRDIEIIASELRGYGPDYGNIDGLALDASNDRLLFSSPYHPDGGDTSRSGALFSIDLNDENYTRALISKAGVRGDGPTLHTAMGMVLPSEEAVAYIGDQYAGVIYEVDLETGDRSALEIQCDMPRLKDQELLRGLSLNADESALLVTWDGTTVVERESGECLAYINDWNSHGYVPSRGNSLFSIEQGGLYLLDSETLEKVIISQ